VPAAAGPERETALAEFYEQWKDDSLVMLKWLALQVGTAPLYLFPPHMGLLPPLAPTHGPALHVPPCLGGQRECVAFFLIFY
jgi:hypothetical protein